MDSRMYDDLALERICKERFGFEGDISQMIVREIDVSPTAKASLFLTKKKQLILYVDGHSRLLLSDVKKIVARMGLKAELYMPPKGQPDYFDRVGRSKFRDVFPGRGNPSDEGIMFYRTLAPYNPALILIREVKAGVVYQFDSDSHGSWRQATKFAYRRIRTS